MSSHDLSLLIEEAKRIIDYLSDCSGQETVETYARNNCIMFYEALSKATTSDDVKRAAELLSRFAVDSVEWDSFLFKRITDLANSARALSKNKI